MRTTLKAALAAMALAGAAAAATPAAAQQFGIGIGPHGGISFSYDTGGYCDQWGCPDNFWDMPVYYGSVFFAGQWYDGPVYYRDWRGEREYWIHGQWRRDEWRGPRPGWYRPGRFGPALGMEYYRSHNFHGRWDQDRGRNFGPDNRGRDFGSRGDDRGRDFGPRGDDRRPDFGPGGDNRRDGFNGTRDNRQDQRGQDQRGQGNSGNRGASQGPQQNAAPAAPNQAPGAFNPRLGKGQRYDRPEGAPAPAAPPAAAQPAAAPAAAPPDNANRGSRGDHGDGGGDHQGRRGGQ